MATQFPATQPEKSRATATRNGTPVPAPEVTAKAVTLTAQSINAAPTPDTAAQAADGAAPGAGERHQRIAIAAYFLAEKRNFEGGHETEDWLAAEALVDGADGI